MPEVLTDIKDRSVSLRFLLHIPNIIQLLRSTFLTKPGPEISCVSVLNAIEMTEDVSGLVSYDMQRYVIFHFLCFLVLHG